MNCQRFVDQMEEYLDGEISYSELKAADLHLETCPACREALQRHLQTSQTLSTALQQATESLRIRLDLEQVLLREWSKRSPAPARWHLPDWLAVRRAWRWSAAFGLLVVVGLLVRLVVSLPDLGKGGGPIAALDPEVPIHASYHVLSRTFITEDGFVRDSLSDQTVVVNGRLWQEPKGHQPRN